MRTSRYSWVLTMRCIYIVLFADVKLVIMRMSACGMSVPMGKPGTT
ncbi:MAG TPA: hypothetical protein VLH75_13555 [Longimicrobiales bacterium]|nr:hypothetical protein [Longimicrobiales bacterium]